MNVRYSLLSNKERETILNSFFTENSITTDFFLNTDEINRIKKFDRSYISLGYALQYLFLKNRGISIVNQYKLIPKNVINYVAEQLNYSNYNLDKYWSIHATKFRHFNEIYKSLNYTKFGMDTEIESIVYNITFTTGSGFVMVKKFIKELRSKLIIIPTISTLEEILSKGLVLSDKKIYTSINEQIKNKALLNTLLDVEKMEYLHIQE